MWANLKEKREAWIRNFDLGFVRTCMVVEGMDANEGVNRGGC